jgi:ankyrin repeat protein
MGADVNLVDADKLSDLALACHHGDIDIVRLLLDKGCRLLSTGERVFSPLHVAASTGRREVAKFLLDRGANVAVAENDG